MDAGKLNRRIVIQSQTATQDAIGQPLPDTWTTFATVWAHIKFNSGYESIKGEAVASIARASMRIRYREDITNKMRVTHNSITYEIKAVMPDEAKREFVDLACEVISV